MIQFGHVQKMPEARLSKQVLQWKPERRRQLCRPRRNWQSGINEYMMERGLEKDICNNKEYWI